MNVHSATAAAEGSGDAPKVPAYPAFVTNALRFDLTLCVLGGLLALAALAALIHEGPDGNLDPAWVFIDLGVSFGIAGCGIAGSLLLLRRRHGGLLFAGTALLLVCISIGLSLQSLRWQLADPDGTCPPESLVSGYVVGLFFRVLVNLIHFDAVRRAARFLRRLPSLPG